MRISYKIFFFLLGVVPHSAWSQAFQGLSFEVEEFLMPFAGGINNPQFSAIDFNRDGYNDLFVFDRACNCITLFQNLGQPNIPNYLVRPDWKEGFPDLKNWAMLKDFNGDGLPDIFSYSDIPGIDGIIVYKSTMKNDSFFFERLGLHPTFNIIHFSQPSGALTPIYVSKIDYPAIEDVDCDGDMDIVTFNSGGGVIEFYRNLAIESGFSLDTLLFERADRCWGGIYESGISETIDLSDNPGECFENVTEPEIILPRHAGSTLLVLDANGDQIKDLFLGDISFSNLTLLTNAGDCETSWFNHQEIYYPQSDEPIQINVFPVAFPMDLNNDGLLDLIVASNDRLNGDDQQNIWWYEGSEPYFLSNPKLRSQTFLKEEMIDLGRNSSVIVIDVTSDGLPDIIMSGDQKNGDKVQSRLVLFQNIGDHFTPRFELINDDFLSLSNFEFTTAFAPAFGDIDGDGIMDIVIGEQSGSLFFGKGTLDENQVFHVQEWQFPFEDIDVGNYSQPFIFDFNKDGLGDLFIGEQTGNINYLENNGMVDDWFSNTLNHFPNNEFFGNIDARFPGYFFGYSAPFVFENEDGIHLITGSEAGFFKHFVSDNNFSPFYEINDPINSLYAGTRTTPFLYDITEDGYLELFTGNFRGGALVYGTSYLKQNKVAVEEHYAAEFSLYPNPTTGIVYLKNDNQLFKNVEVTIYDVKGSTIFHQKSFNLTMNPIILDKKGVYFIQVIDTPKIHFTEKIIVY